MTDFQPPGTPNRPRFTLRLAVTVSLFVLFCCLVLALAFVFYENSGVWFGR